MPGLQRRSPGRRTVSACVHQRDAHCSLGYELEARSDLALSKCPSQSSTEITERTMARLHQLQAVLPGQAVRQHRKQRGTIAHLPQLQAAVPVLALGELLQGAPLPGPPGLQAELAAPPGAAT